MSLTVFEFQDYPVRFVGTPERPEWIAKDVCHCLGIVNHRSALATLEEHDKGVVKDDTSTGVKHLLTVYESGLYELIFKSRKPSAKAFKRWVFEEVLPSIRKTGSYSANYQNLDLQALELEVKRKKLILENIKLDHQLENHNQPDIEFDESLAKITQLLEKILKIVKRKGECTAGQVHSALGGGNCKLSSKEVGEHLVTLVSMGKLKRVSTKKGVRVKI